MPVQILHIENNKKDRLSLTRIFLFSIGKLCRVNSFYSSKEALRFFTSGKTPNQTLPDLIITDETMLGKNGSAIAEFISSVPELKNIPLVMLSSSTQNADINEAYKNGVSSYIVKPVSPAKLRHIFQLTVKTANA